MKISKDFVNTAFHWLAETIAIDKYYCLLITATVPNLLGSVRLGYIKLGLIRFGLLG